jgi:hypothetical protein
MTHRFHLFIVLGACALTVACDTAPTPPSTTAERATDVGSKAPRVAEGVIDAAPLVATSTYRLALTAIEGAAEYEQAFEVSLAGVGDWHVNTEYPIAVTVAADEGLALEKRRLDRGDATLLSDDVARFSFVAKSSGKAPSGRVNAHVKFAMCIPTSCTFHDETVGLALPPK